jgi:hypothetical protein
MTVEMFSEENNRKAQELQLPEIAESIIKRLEEYSIECVFEDQYSSSVGFAARVFLNTKDKNYEFKISPWIYDYILKEKPYKIIFYRLLPAFLFPDAFFKNEKIFLHAYMTDRYEQDIKEMWNVEVAYECKIKNNINK